MKDPSRHPSYLLQDFMFGKGWSRAVPANALAIYTEMIFAEVPLTRDELHVSIAASVHTPDGLRSSVWEPLNEWTDEEIAQLDHDFPQFESSESQSAEDVTAKERAEREVAIADLDRYFESKGLKSDHTLGGLLELLVACEVILRGEDGRYRFNADAPLPGEALPLSPEEAATQDEMRWERIHEPVAQAIIKMFRPEGEDVDQLLTDLGQLSSHLGKDAEDARSAIQVLLANGDFAASVDVETVEMHQSFVLRVDWEKFHASRISVRFGGSGVEDEPV